MTNEVKSLLLQLVRTNPADRLSATEALQSPWFKLKIDDQSNLSTAIQQMQKRKEQKRSKAKGHHATEKFSMA